jgi:hypothetical protein
MIIAERRRDLAAGPRGVSPSVLPWRLTAWRSRPGASASVARRGRRNGCAGLSASRLVAFAWVWLRPPCAARAVSAPGVPRRLAHGHRVRSRPPALARPHVPCTAPFQPLGGSHRSACDLLRAPPAWWPRSWRGSFRESAPGGRSRCRPCCGWPAVGPRASHGGFPWGLIRFSQHGILPTIQIASSRASTACRSSSSPSAGPQPCQLRWRRVLPGALGGAPPRPRSGSA